MRDMEQCLREYHEERAGILEYCAGLPREKAEALARAETESWRRSRETAARDSEVQK